jgi:aminopeptidase YwaD
MRAASCRPVVVLVCCICLLGACTARPEVAITVSPAAPTVQAPVILHAQTATATPPRLGLRSTPLPANVFSSSRAYQDDVWLSESIGARPAGSDAERRAAGGLADRLRQAGYDVALQPFTFDLYEDRGAVLRLDAGGSVTFTVRSLRGSGSGVVRGPLIDVGLGTRAEVSRHKLQGAIALVRRGNITFFEKAMNTAAAGALGVVIYNDRPGTLRGTLRDEMYIPVVALAQEDGERLARQLSSRALQVEVAVNIVKTLGTSYNVVAERRGASRDTILLGAHYDGVPDGPAANDNASGVATALELARILGAQPVSLTVRVVLFGAEEVGLIGSRHYVTSLDAGARERIVAMLNFDMVGVGDQPQAGGSDDMIALAQELAVRLGAPVAQVGAVENGSSDHATFIEAGIPALFFYRAEDLRYHTALDQAGYVEPDHLAFAGNLALAVVDALSAGRGAGR